MEVQNGKKFLLKVLLAEFLGTCGLMLGYNMSDGSSIIALTYYLMVLLTIRISGGHVNPAVTLGVYIERKEYATNILFAISIMFSQVVGALLALAIGYMLRVTIQSTDG